MLLDNGRLARDFMSRLQRSGFFFDADLGLHRPSQQADRGRFRPRLVYFAPLALGTVLLPQIGSRLSFQQMP